MSLNNLLVPGEGNKTASASPEIAAWLKELDAAQKREKSWRKDASELVEMYECGKAKEYQFNILFSNTETMLPALYNNMPRPVVKRRFNDADPIGKTASDVVQRTLAFLLDNEVSDYTPFDDLMAQSTLEALVPGRGVVRFKYDASFTEVENEAAAEVVAADEGGEAETDESAEDSPPPEVTYETVCGELIPWNRFLHGYAKQWRQVPWVAFEHFMSKEELERNFGAAGAQVPLTITGATAENMSNDERDDRTIDDAGGAKLGHVYEIWDKDTKRVLFIAPAKPEAYLKAVDDPLHLTGFFPMPRPLSFFQKINSLTPVPLYKAYEEQAKELNRVTVRINKIVQALKVRGFYDGTLEGLDRVLQADDNVLIPAENVAAMQQGQTLEKAIWLMPLEKLIAVLQQLYLQRTQVKQVIYEITGISDILRGASAASETATAQNIKNQWGTLRLKRSQKIVMQYVRESLRIMAEIACSKLSTQTLAGMTGLQFPTAEQKGQAQMMLQQLQRQQPPQQPGQPPAPQAGQLQQLLAQPSWEEIQGMLANDLQRNYKIDIETNSTVDAEATEDKANMGEYLNAVAQFMNGVAPMVQNGTMPFDAAKSILLAVTRRYRFGTEVEDDIAKMRPPQPPADPNAGKMQAEQAKAQLEMQKLQAETQARQAELQMELQFRQAELQLKQQELALKAQEMQQKAQLAELQFQQQVRQAQLEATRPQKPAKPGNTRSVTTA